MFFSNNKIIIIIFNDIIIHEMNDGIKLIYTCTNSRLNLNPNIIENFVLLIHFN